MSASKASRGAHGGRTVDAIGKRRLRFREAQPQPLLQVMDAPLQARRARNGRLPAAPAVERRTEQGGRKQAERSKHGEIVSCDPAQ